MQNNSKFTPIPEIVVEDAENFRSSSSKGIKEIATTQFETCLKEGSKCMNPSNNNNSPDQKEVFNNCVEMLQTALIKLIKETPGAKERLKLIDEQCQNLVKETDNNIKLQIQEVAKINKLTIRDSKKISPDALANSITLQKYATMNIIVGLYRKKLYILSELLADNNYFDEIATSNYGE